MKIRGRRAPLMTGMKVGSTFRGKKRFERLRVQILLGMIQTRFVCEVRIEMTSNFRLNNVTKIWGVHEWI